MAGTTRKRISTPSTTVFSGGGGPAPTIPVVDIGPDFGEGAGSDEVSFGVNCALSLTNLSLVGGVAAQAAVAMPKVAPAGGTGGCMLRGQSDI